MCSPKGNDFPAILIRNRVSILASLVLNRVWLLYFSLEMSVLFKSSYFFIMINKTIKKSPLKTIFRATASVATASISLYRSFGRVINRVGKIADCGHT